jgi:hypothetical protein
MHGKHYKMLAVMGILSFICMYILMYSMTDTIRNVFPNVNQFYMAALMVMPMIIIEIVLMKHMYMSRTLNMIIIGFSSVALVAFYLLIRQQTGVSDRQFLRSMIPHHSGAILMCEKADIQDPEIKKLCEEIIASQQREIQQMKTKLDQLDKSNESKTASTNLKTGD